MLVAGYKEALLYVEHTQGTSSLQSHPVRSFPQAITEPHSIMRLALALLALVAAVTAIPVAAPGPGQ